MPIDLFSILFPQMRHSPSRLTYNIAIIYFLEKIYHSIKYVFTKMGYKWRSILGRNGKFNFLPRVILHPSDRKKFIKWLLVWNGFYHNETAMHLNQADQAAIFSFWLRYNMERGWTNHGLQVNQHNKPGSPVNSAQEAILREKNKRVNASGVHSVQAMERLSYTIACIISMTGAAASITNGLHQFLTIHDI